MNRTERVSKINESNLPFASRAIVRIELAELDLTEEGFDWRGVVAVWSRINEL